MSIEWRSYPKNKPDRDKNYLRNICAFGCSVPNCENSAIPHHLKGYKLGGMKASDYLAIPLCDQHHSATYDTGIHYDIKKWEEEHEMQPIIIIRVLLIAHTEGLINKKNMDKNIEFCQELLMRSQ